MKLLQQRIQQWLEYLEATASFYPFTKIRYHQKLSEFYKKESYSWYRRAEAISKYAPTAKCQYCGGENLFPDQGGLYRDAEGWDGAPYICMDCYDEHHRDKR